MRKKIFILLLLGITIINIKAQDQAKTIKNQFIIGLSPNYTFYQDTKFSNIQYQGTGIGLSLGYQRENQKSLWSLTMDIQNSTQTAATHKNNSPSALNATLHFDYLHKIYRLRDWNLWLGGRWDMADLFLHEDNTLGNNATHFLTNSTLFLSTKATKTINPKWDVSVDLNWALAGYVKESTSFAFSSPQHLLEDGKYSYQDDELGDPDNFNFYDLEFCNSYQKLYTNINFTYKKRWGFSYQWNMAHYTKVSKHPLTYGGHKIGISYTFGKKR